MNRALLLAALLVALPAQADVWKTASSPNDPSADNYNTFMQKGDDAVLAANAQSLSVTAAVRQVEMAIEAYRTAAKFKPKSGEPFYRIGATLNSFYFDDCEGALLNRPPPMTCTAPRVDRMAKAREMVEAWDQFEALSPLDPRINDLLVTRAITRTKLVSASPKPQPLLEAAAKDYQALLDREDGLLKERYGSGLGRMLVLGNLAETYMMLGDIDRAIVVYLDAKRNGARNSTMYGLAVALDRDDRSGDAAAVIRSMGQEDYTAFHEEWERGSVFFVPAGEEQYYFALANEVLGNTTLAIDHWKQYIRSGAHPQFQPRAKEHLEKLTLRRSLPQITVPLARDLGGTPEIVKSRSPFDPAAPPPPPPTRRPRRP